jgi:hypothetical protein
MTRAEGVLLAAAAAVLLGGVVGALTVNPDGDGAGTAGPVPHLSASPSASASEAPTPAATPSAGQVQVGSLARGSHSLVVTAHVTGATAVDLRDGDRTVPLHLVGSTASGTVPVDCAAGVPSWTLELTAADGSVTTLPVPAPTGAFAQACAEPLPAGPVPASTRGS